MKYVWWSVSLVSLCEIVCVCVYLMVEVVQCWLVFCKLLHKALWKISDRSAAHTYEEGKQKILIPK